MSLHVLLEECGADDDGTGRPLREERETPRTPTRAAGGAAGPGPDASGRTPMVRT